MYDVARGNRDRRGERGEHPSEEVITQIVVDRVTEQIHRKAEQVTEKLHRKVEQHAEKMGRLGPLDGALDLWLRTEPGARKPRFTRDQIASAALRIADTDGLGGLSMRRLAADLDAGTMTLYHYVRTKDELLALINDAVMGEVGVPPTEELPTDWRAAMTTIARRTRAAFERHPWVFDIASDTVPGPNGMRHFDQSLQAVASLATMADKLDVIFAVDEYVFGYCLSAREEASTASDDMIPSYLEELARSGDYPETEALLDAHGMEGVWSQISSYRRDADRFDRNLARLLDGLHRGLTGGSDAPTA